jgi:hypothetical protein
MSDACENERNMIRSQVYGCVLYRHEEKPLGDGMYISMITTIKGENPTI